MNHQVRLRAFKKKKKVAFEQKKKNNKKNKIKKIMHFITKQTNTIGNEHEYRRNLARRLGLSAAK